MSATERILKGIKDVMRMNDEIRRLSDGLKDLMVEVRDIDKRLVRIETMAEMSQARVIKPAGRVRKNDN